MRLAVRGLGMISSVGYDVVTSCASARSGIIRASELDYEILNEESAEMEPIKGHIIKGFTDGFVGPGRLTRLGAAALDDLINYANLQEEWEPKTAIFVHLGDNYYDDVLFERGIKDMADSVSSASLDEMNQLHRQDWGQRQENIQNILIPQILQINGVSISTEAQFYSFGGPSGFVDVIMRAMDLLERGDMKRCILGGIDSLVDGEMLETLHQLDLLQSVKNPDGFFPGEVAAFVLVERFDSSKQSGTEAILESPALVKGSFHRFSEAYPDGKALTKAIITSFANLFHPTNNIELAIGNLNGDSFRAKDFGNALLHLAALGLPNDFIHWHPALSIGEVGAATGPVSICLGVRGFVRGYSKSKDILVWLSSDSGARGSFFIRNIY